MMHGGFNLVRGLGFWAASSMPGSRVRSMTANAASGLRFVMRGSTRWCSQLPNGFIWFFALIVSLAGGSHLGGK